MGIIWKYEGNMDTNFLIFLKDLIFLLYNANMMAMWTYAVRETLAQFNLEFWSFVW
jgi:hypothetical protein